MKNFQYCAWTRQIKKHEYVFLLTAIGKSSKMIQALHLDYVQISVKHFTVILLVADKKSSHTKLECEHDIITQLANFSSAKIYKFLKWQCDIIDDVIITRKWSYLI